MALVLLQTKLNLSLKLKVQVQVQLIVVPASCLESDTSLKTIGATFASLIVYVRNRMREKRGRARTFYHPCSSPAISPQSRHKRLMCCQESITLCKVILPSHNPGFSQRPRNNLTARNLTKKGVYGIETPVKHILISPLISICVQALCTFKI